MDKDLDDILNLIKLDEYEKIYKERMLNENEINAIQMTIGGAVEASENIMKTMGRRLVESEYFILLML